MFHPIIKGKLAQSIIIIPIRLQLSDVLRLCRLQFLQGCVQLRHRHIASLESLLRDFAEIFEEMLDEFLRLTSVQRHNLIWIMEAALSEEGNELHADSKYKHLPTSLLTRRATIEPDENAEVIEDATTSTSTD